MLDAVFTIPVVITVFIGILGYYLQTTARILEEATINTDEMSTSVKAMARAGPLYIPVPPMRLFGELRARIFPSATSLTDRKRFGRFAELLSLALNTDSSQLVTELSHDFAVVGAVGGGEQDSSSTDRATTSVRFLYNLHTVLERCNFAPLSPMATAFAAEAHYDVNVPVFTNWDAFDRSDVDAFFGDALGTHFKPVPPLAEPTERGVLMWHRGYGVAEKRGTLIPEKVDALLEIAFDWLTNTVLGSYLWNALPFTIKVPGITSLADSLDKLAQNPDMPPESIAVVKKLVSERRLLKDVPGLLWKLFDEVTIHEPTMSRVVVLYSLKVPKGEKPRYQLKMFRDVPFADADLVLPESSISVKPLDFLALAIPSVIGIFYLLNEIIGWATETPSADSEGVKDDSSSSVTLLTVFLSLVGLIVKIYFDVSIRMGRARAALTEALYHKAADSQEGVIYVLAREMVQQEWKEALVAYTLLLEAGEAGLSVDELDKRAEKLIMGAVPTGLGYLDVDFEVDDALAKLARYGLAEPLPGGAVVAVPLKRATKRLEKRMVALASAVRGEAFADAQTSLEAHLALQAAAAAAEEEEEDVGDDDESAVRRSNGGHTAVASTPSRYGDDDETDDEISEVVAKTPRGTSTPSRNSTLPTLQVKYRLANVLGQSAASSTSGKSSSRKSTSSSSSSKSSRRKSQTIPSTPSARTKDATKKLGSELTGAAADLNRLAGRASLSVRRRKPSKKDTA
jgi:hypothetical protein